MVPNSEQLTKDRGDSIATAEDGVYNSYSLVPPLSTRAWQLKGALESAETFLLLDVPSSHSSLDLILDLHDSCTSQDVDLDSFWNRSLQEDQSHDVFGFERRRGAEAKGGSKHDVELEDDIEEAALDRALELTVVDLLHSSGETSAETLVLWPGELLHEAKGPS